MDINGDGFNDILSGCYSQSGHASMVGSFWVMYGDKDGKFAKPVELKGTDGKLLQIIPDLSGNGDSRLTKNICTRPFAVDWDGDGKLDLIVGNFEGTFYMFKGEGKGKFAPEAVQLMDKDGKALKISGVHSDPFIVDWDGDGDLDLLTGSSDGKIFWAENISKRGETETGTARMPVLTALKILINAPSGKDAVGPKSSLRIDVADINGDGKLDILVGDRVSSGGGMRSDMSDEEQAEFKKANEDYQAVSREYSEAYGKYRDAYTKAVEEAEKEHGRKLTREEMGALQREHISEKVAKDENLQALQRQMRELNTTLSKYRIPSVVSGNVWVYEQK